MGHPAATTGVEYDRLAPFGAVVDIDLGAELDPGTVEALRALYQEQHVLIFRGQALAPEQQLRAARYFGPVPDDGLGMISNDPAIGLQGDTRLAFHSDQAYGPEPDLGVSLYAVDVLDDASSTSFASGVRAYQQLPQSLKDRIEDLHVLLVWPIDQTARNRLSSLSDTDPRYEHPVVMKHAKTGEQLLYLTEMQTDRIVELPEPESERLITELFGYLYAPENILEHRWRRGDFVVWDNVALQHGRRDLSGVGPRSLRRTSIARLSFFELFPQFKPHASGFIDTRHELSTSG